MSLLTLTTSGRKAVFLGKCKILSRLAVVASAFGHLGRGTIMHLKQLGGNVTVGRGYQRPLLSPRMRVSAKLLEV